MASNADPDAPRTTEIPALADGGGGGVLAAQADKKPEYYVTVILYKDHKRLPGLIQQVEDAGCVVAMSNCTVAPTFTFIMPKGVRNPLEELAAEEDSHMRCIITKVKALKNREVARPPQLERTEDPTVNEEDW